MSFEDSVRQRCQRIDDYLQQLLDGRDNPATGLHAAMRYSMFNGGKRLRPVLVYATVEALGGELQWADPAAAAVECIHAYSLIHDDLPAMDDDDLRRGQPTCHIAFDEATAILAGDALQTLAFDVLSRPLPGLAASTQLAMLQVLASASGDRGMVAGQVMDMGLTGQGAGSRADLEQLQQMHRLKTGALIRASVALGALASGQVTESQRQALDTYADALGLAFQVQDDILDVAGDTATLGKQQGADVALNKLTYPALLGLDGARDKLQQLHAQALEALTGFDERALLLRQLADFVVSRNH